MSDQCGASVDLHPAFHWMCDRCGSGNYGSVAVMQSDAYGACHGMMRNIYIFPDHVHCLYCGTGFDTVITTYAKPH